MNLFKKQKNHALFTIIYDKSGYFSHFCGNFGDKLFVKFVLVHEASAKVGQRSKGIQFPFHFYNKYQSGSLSVRDYVDLGVSSQVRV